MESTISRGPRDSESRPLAAAPAPMLRIDGVSVRFGGIKALDGVSFEVGQREICGLIGPNGAGKSTMFNCLSGIYPCNEGRIVFDGSDLAQTPQNRMARLGIGRTFQNLALFRGLSVRDNVKVGCHSQRRSGVLAAALRTKKCRAEEQRIQTETDELLEFLGLTACAEAPVADLPFGTQKRVELARALAAKPKLLLLDEPACGLNHEEVHALGDLIGALREKFGMSVLLVEHHMGLVMRLSERLVVLNFGSKIAEGLPSDVRAHPEVVRAYTGQ